MKYIVQGKVTRERDQWVRIGHPHHELSRALAAKEYIEESGLWSIARVVIEDAHGEVVEVSE